MIRIAVRILALLAVVYFLGYAAFVVSLPDPAGDQQTDGIVVLTGGPGRIERGVDLLQRHHAQRMLISGVDPNTNDAAVADANHIPADLFACCIQFGHEAFDTRSNATEVLSWARLWNIHSLRLVTSDWHMPRAHHELASRLPDAITILDDAVETHPSFQQLFLEYNKVLLARAGEVIGL